MDGNLICGTCHKAFANPQGLASHRRFCLPVIGDAHQVPAQFLNLLFSPFYGVLSTVGSVVAWVSMLIVAYNPYRFLDNFGVARVWNSLLANGIDAIYLSCDVRAAVAAAGAVAARPAGSDCHWRLM